MTLATLYTDCWDQCKRGIKFVKLLVIFKFQTSLKMSKMGEGPINVALVNVLKQQNAWTASHKYIKTSENDDKEKRRL